nr:hypothetical protein [Tanacetum cinerariifolium]
MCENDIQTDQNAEDEHAALANLIASLKLDVDEKKIQKQLKKANTSLAHELEQCKSILAETSKTLEKSNSVRDSCLVALQTKQTEFEKYKACNDRTIDYDKLKRKLNETLGLLAQKDIGIIEGLKIKAYEISVVKEKHDELVKHSLLTKSYYEGLVIEKIKFRSQRTMNVAGARENVGSPVVQQFGIQSFNCKEFGHFAKECRKPKRVKDFAYHKEKMLLCKQAGKGAPLQVEQSDWLADTNDEIDEQELEAHYSYMAKIQEVPIVDSDTNSEPLEQVQYNDEYNVFANMNQHLSTFLLLEFEEVPRLLLVGSLSSSESDSDGGVIGLAISLPLFLNVKELVVRNFIQFVLLLDYRHKP